MDTPPVAPRTDAAPRQFGQEIDLNQSGDGTPLQPPVPCKPTSSPAAASPDLLCLATPRAGATVPPSEASLPDEGLSVMDLVLDVPGGGGSGSGVNTPWLPPPAAAVRIQRAARCFVARRRRRERRRMSAARAVIGRWLWSVTKRRACQRVAAAVYVQAVVRGAAARRRCAALRVVAAGLAAAFRGARRAATTSSPSTEPSTAAPVDESPDIVAEEKAAVVSAVTALQSENAWLFQALEGTVASQHDQSSSLEQTKATAEDLRAQVARKDAEVQRLAAELRQAQQRAAEAEAAAATERAAKEELIALSDELCAESEETEALHRAAMERACADSRAHCQALEAKVTELQASLLTAQSQVEEAAAIQEQQVQYLSLFKTRSEEKFATVSQELREAEEDVSSLVGVVAQAAATLERHMDAVTDADAVAAFKRLMEVLVMVGDSTADGSANRDATEDE